MLTVFTPTYNRSYIIDKLYKSLLTQTNKNFEWLVVDDGSTDDTEEYFAEILNNDNPFKIRYIKQPNGGKHRAINKGVQLANGELFFIVDSDDYLTSDAVEKLLKWRESLDGSKKWAGVSGERGYDVNKHIGGVYEKSPYIDAKNNERYKYNLGGDKAEAYFTEVLKKYPFPEFEGENFITEEVVWNAIARDRYYIRWYKDIIYICDYLDDGLTKSGDTKYINNPQGVLYWAKIQLQAFPKNLKKRFSAINRCFEVVKTRMSIKEMAHEVGVSKFYIRSAIFVFKLWRLMKGKN